MRIKSWIERIPLILQRLETDGKAVYTRPEIAELFKIGSSQAANLMKIAGAEVRNGIEATVTRANLKFYIERCPEAKHYLDELERKAKLAARLRQAAVPIIGVKAADEWTRFEDLSNVAIAVGELRIVFSGREDLLHTLWQLGRAIGNEPDLFAQLCDGEPATEFLARA